MSLLKKILIPLVIFVLIGGAFALKAQPASSAAVVYDPWYFLKEFVIYPIVRKIANSLENKLVNKISGQISNINGKVPSFITNWRNHILDSQARGNDVFRAVLADTKLCPQFDKQLKQVFGADLFAGVISGATVINGNKQVVYQNKTTVPGTAPFQLSANCTLPSDFDVNAYKKDFTKGGWDAWDKLIQPQNNFFGAYNLALQEQRKQVSVESQASENSSIAGQGFLSQKLGTVTGSGLGSAGLGPTGCTDSFGSLGTGGEGPIKTSRCVFQGKAVTPEQILGKTAAAAIDKKLGRIGGSTQLTDIILSLFSAVLDATTSKITNYIGQSTYDRPPNSSSGYQETSDQQLQQQIDQSQSQIQNQQGQTGQTITQSQQGCKTACVQEEQARCRTLPAVEQNACLNNTASVCTDRCPTQSTPPAPVAQ